MYINTLLPRVPRRLAENRMAWVYLCQIPKNHVRDGMPSKSLCLPGINPAKNAKNAFFLGRRLRSCNLFGNLPIVHQSTIFLFGLACAKKTHLQVQATYFPIFCFFCKNDFALRSKKTDIIHAVSSFFSQPL